MQGFAHPPGAGLYAHPDDPGNRLHFSTRRSTGCFAPPVNDWPQSVDARGLLRLYTRLSAIRFAGGIMARFRSGILSVAAGSEIPQRPGFRFKSSPQMLRPCRLYRIDQPDQPTEGTAQRGLGLRSCWWSGQS